MTMKELKEEREMKAKNKFKSRTFWITIAWMIFIPAGFVAQVLMQTIEIPISTIVNLAGAVTLVYVGGNKAGNVATTLKLDK